MRKREKSDCKFKPMKIFEITLRDGVERKYVYCSLNSVDELSPDIDFYDSYLDCKQKQNKISSEASSVKYLFIKQAIKKYLEKSLVVI